MALRLVMGKNTHPSVITLHLTKPFAHDLVVEPVAVMHEKPCPTEQSMNSHLWRLCRS